MKKLLLVIALFAGVLMLNVKAVELPEVTNHEKVTIYLFRGHGCSHCYDALSYFYENAETYADYIEIKAYEVWNNETNKTLLTKVAAYFEKTVNGVPFFVIGDNYTSAGFGKNTGDTLVEKALNEYNNPKYKDIVAKIAKDEKIDASQESLEEACAKEGINETTINNSEKETTSSNKNDTLIITAIIVVVLGGTIALITSNRRK